MTNPYSMKCICLPHGFYVCMPAILATIGWLATLTEDGCNYAFLEGSMVTEITTNPDMPFLQVGINSYREPSFYGDSWNIDYKELCMEYNVDIVKIDGVWMFSKVISFMSLVFAGGAVLLIWFSSCFLFSQSTWKWIGCELLTAAMLKILSYSWFATSMCGDNNCSLSYGAKADILACVMWFISGILVLLRYPTPKCSNSPITTNNATPSEASIEMPDIT